MNLVSKDTAILITAYTGGNDPEYHSCGDQEAVMRKRMMTKTLVKYLLVNRWSCNQVMFLTQEVCQVKA
jgi:hypothetical protein